MSNIDKRALREAAEKATPGRIGDRIDGSGSIKYQCFGNDGSLVLQTDHKNMEYGFIGENSEADELFFRMCDPTTVLALLDELEAKDKRIAELSALQGKPIAWESTTPVYVKFITDERYQRLRPGYKKWYKPYRCSQCAVAGKGEVS